MMVATFIALSAVLAALMALAAARKLTHSERVVHEYARAGVPEDKLNLLAAGLLIGVVGLIAGIFWRPVSGVAAAGTLIYFLAAIAFHVRARDYSHVATPAALAALAGATLVLALQTG